MLESLPHLPGCLVGEGHRQDGMWANGAYPDEIGNPVGNYSCLATARAGEDKEWPLHSLYRLLLSGVESFEDIHHESGSRIVLAVRG